MKTQNIIYILIAGVVVILIGAYVLFQGRPSAGLPVASTAPLSLGTTTPTATSSAPAAATPNPSGSSGAAEAPIKVTQSGSLKIAFDASNLVVGGPISPITITVPADASGKYLVLLLKPTIQSAGGVLLGTQIFPSSSTYAIQGLKLQTVSDPKTGAKTSVTPGTYLIEVALWDKNPFGLGGTYTNFAGNTGMGTISLTFTIHAPTP